MISGLASELDGFTIALLTDLHIGPTVDRKRIQMIVDITNSLQVDVVTIVGDLVDGFILNFNKHALPLLNLTSKYGKYFATGICLFILFLI